MNVTGKWKIAASLTVDDDGKQVWKTVEEIKSDPEADPFDLQMYDSIFIFSEDGFVRTIVALPDDTPQEEIDAAVEAGEIELYEPGFIAMEKTPWKEEDGKVFFDSGVEGEVFDEKVDSWTEIIPTDDGIRYATLRLVRADD